MPPAPTLLAVAVAAAAVFRPRRAFCEETLILGTLKDFEDLFHLKAAESLEKEGVKVALKDLSGNSAHEDALCLALANGDIELSTRVTLEAVKLKNRDYGAGLASLGPSYLTGPMGFYSRRIGTLDELGEGAVVAVPNDPESRARALLLLRDSGKIGLNDVFPTTDLTLSDIVSNPLNLRIEEVPPEDLPERLEDSDALALNGFMLNYAGLKPLRDAIRLEGADSPFASAFVLREADKDKPKFAKFLKAFRTREMADLILSKYDGRVIPVFPVG
ncbi:MAG: MetQ/NlpA family ABC transporter substrate-binding protein [Deltaproteobacteria bacterium]|jgi:D-methionine transport system substrate-binding protein|nr:MetQ/NlpA family ABC transporter substrate-binding protein [Deltaproteobacteria bacterium]